MSRRIGVVPWLIRDGKLHVVLVRSVDGDRWVLPKGKPKRGMPSRDLAALEAWEEAGVRGRLHPKEAHESRLIRQGEVLKLRLYPLEISRLANRWPERRSRRRRVVRAARAIALLSDPGMAAAVKALARRVKRQRG